MNEKMNDLKNTTIEFWQGKTKKQQRLLIFSFVFILLLLLTVLWFGSRTNYVPLYSNLTLQETGEIKGILDARGVPSEIVDNGTTILVPENSVNELKVNLAAEGVPNSGRIDYGTFRDNMGFGTTDNEFNLLERAALQSNIEDLIRNITGVRAAQVMITIPEGSFWVTDDQDQATASVLVNMETGYRLDQSQVRALYHLVSKSVPNLPVENIVIMDQLGQFLELNDDPSGINSSLTVYEQQRNIQREIERDIQRQLQQMLGTMMGPDKVLVSVTTDLDFTQENRQEQLVTPVDEENMSGIAVSVERITETYTGDDVPEGGIPGTGEDDVPGYPGGATGNAGDYERIEERINNDFNRIQREIVESPYKIRDIGIQVMVEPPDPDDPQSLPFERINDIQQILSQIVRTSIDMEYTDGWEQQDFQDRIFVSSQPFFGKVNLEEPPTGIPSWYFIVGALVLFIIVLLFLLFRRSKKVEETEEEETEEPSEFEMPPIEERNSEERARRMQLEKLAREKPDEFSKLIRTWLSED
ncbi:flagellar basal-body MS-ring/collar protein FliF [Evansella tamaricis]|uniref:Flagellar M-ring protein n=1 Tax=Evansella tamaricis TaxID=2069301 RepID=A0ABS6JLJ9_9BACI|nr:flagellar basal-body MS-ring/collar protein FliF [Evansella tamaricis]MBU9714556.1 flagellar M-ring protein FliF [Evansella tamaricis]